MKKLFCTLLALTLCLAGDAQVSAAGPQEPKIESDFPDCYGIMD